MNQVVRMNKILLEVDDVIPINSNIIVIKHKTTIFYTAQTGGTNCLHPEVEGYILGDMENFDIIDDCKYFCSIWPGQIPKNKIDEYIIDFKRNILETKCIKYQLDIDIKNINEIHEGWIPVLISYEDKFIKLKLNKAPGILITGNCD